MATWTTNSLFTAIILVAGAGFGRQVLSWWATDSAQPQHLGEQPRPVHDEDNLADPSTAHTIQFGDQPWSIQRQSFVGSKESAVKVLLAACRKGVEGAEPLYPRPDSAEQQLLMHLAGRQSIDEKPGDWSLFDCGQGFPMIVGTRQSSKSSPPEAGSQLAKTGPRVVIWGLGVPTDGGGWALFTFRPQRSSPERSSNEEPGIPLPEESNRVLSLQAGGMQVIAFTTADQGGRWVRFYDDWLGRHGWNSPGAWRRIGAGWHGHYGRGQERRAVVDIRFSPDGRGRLTGLIMVSTSPLGRGSG